MPPVFPEVDRIELAVSMLELVVCQVRFPAVLALSPAQPPAEFQQRVREHYPKARLQGEDSLEVGGPQALRFPRSAYWAFQDRRSEWTVSLASNFLSLETTEYVRFDEFIMRFVEALQIAREIYPIEIRERLGLRYVDRISVEKHPGLPKHWPDLVRPEVLPLRKMRGKGEPQMNLLENRFAFDDSVLAVRALYTDEGFPGATHDQLVLDFDCYSEAQGDFGDINLILQKFHDITYRAFRWMVGDLITVFGRVGEASRTQ